jgi:hypothetical protein
MKGWWSRLPTVADPHLRPAALRLGVAAVLPFVVGAAAVLLARGAMKDQAAAALGAYASTVVSFLGGIHWGFGFRTSQPPSSLFLWGVVPSLVSWAALMLPVAPALALYAAMLSACFLVDRVVYPRQGAGAWLPLRFRLTLVAVVSCVLGCWGLLSPVLLAKPSGAEHIGLASSKENSSAAGARTGGAP